MLFITKSSIFPNGRSSSALAAHLLIAAVLGGWIGFERQRERKAAGLRTHILVAMGAALFAIASLEAGMTISDAGRVFQGIATGIGFIGAGAILKLTEQQEIKVRKSAEHVRRCREQVSPQTFLAAPERLGTGSLPSGEHRRCPMARASQPEAVSVVH